MTYKFYKTLSFEDSIDHPRLGYDINDLTSYRCWYEEDIKNRSTLLVMVGDSWTWGDHLGNIDWKKSINDPIRYEQIAGRKLAHKLDADLVNLARPGCSNYWMLEKLQDIEPWLQIAKNHYKRIIIIVNLTEDLREAQYTRRIKIDDIYDKFFNDSKTLKDFLCQVEKNLFLNLEAYFDDLPFIESHIARVFTDVWPGNASKLLLEMSWCDVIQQYVQFPLYQKPVPFIGQMSIDPLTKKYIDKISDPEKINSYKTEFVEIMENVGYRWNFLGASDYNLKGSTYHPNDLGHTVWAEYLYAQLNK